MIVKKFMISFVEWKESSFRLTGFLQYIKSKSAIGVFIALSANVKMM